MSVPLKAEFDFYLSNQSDLVEKFNGRVVVIKGDQVLGDYDSEFAALQETKKAHTPGTFLIQRCTPGPDAYTQIFHRMIPV